MELLRYISNIKIYSIEDILNKEIYIKIRSIENIRKLNKLLKEYNKLFCLFSNTEIISRLENYKVIYIQLIYNDELDDDNQYSMTWYSENELRCFDEYIIIEDIGDIYNGTVKIY